MMYACSDGSKVTQATINRNLSLSYYTRWGTGFGATCLGCERERAVDNDHTISQKRCKQIGKTELIWDWDNFEPSCRQCHTEWEAVKNPAWMNHKNAQRRMDFIKLHDPEEFNKRLNFVINTNYR